MALANLGGAAQIGRAVEPREIGAGIGEYQAGAPVQSGFIVGNADQPINNSLDRLQSLSQGALLLASIDFYPRCEGREISRR